LLYIDGPLLDLSARQVKELEMGSNLDLVELRLREHKKMAVSA